MLSYKKDLYRITSVGKTIDMSVLQIGTPFGIVYVKDFEESYKSNKDFVILDSNLEYLTTLDISAFYTKDIEETAFKLINHIDLGMNDERYNIEQWLNLRLNVHPYVFSDNIIDIYDSVGYRQISDINRVGDNLFADLY